VNAYEMLQNGRYFGLYYDGMIDTWNSKPPLMIWLICLSYKILGFSVLALRIPAFLAFLGTLYFVYKCIVHFESRKLAFYCMGILISCKAFLGYHMAINGDFDMVLVFFLTAGLYYFIKFYFNNNNFAILYSSIFIACAFLTKGPPALIYLPGIFIFLLLHKSLLPVIKKPHFWIGFIVLMGFIGIWYFNSRSYVFSGKSHYGSHNPIETLFIHDTFNRIFTGDFKSDTTRHYDFVPSVLESRFGIWFFTGILLFLIFLFVKKNNVKRYVIFLLKKPLVALSICISIPICILLTFSANQNSWYLAPVFIFFSILLGYLFLYSEKLFKFHLFYLIVLTAASVFQILYMHRLSVETETKFKNKTNYSNNQYYLIEDTNKLKHFKQNMNLYFKWNNNTCKRLNIDSINKLNSSDKIMISVADYPLLKNIPINIENKIEDYLFFTLKIK
jgi:4-amino-4-deoxy-L-arabinose transferase-like glycosyltransferase